MPVYPAGNALGLARDRLYEKVLFQELDIPTVPFAEVDSPGDLERAVASFGFPAVLKTRTLGYDGKGQRELREPRDLPGAWEQLGGAPPTPRGRTVPSVSLSSESLTGYITAPSFASAFAFSMPNTQLKMMIWNMARTNNGEGADPFIERRHEDAALAEPDRQEGTDTAQGDERRAGLPAGDAETLLQERHCRLIHRQRAGDRREEEHEEPDRSDEIAPCPIWAKTTGRVLKPRPNEPPATAAIVPLRPRKMNDAGRRRTSGLRV